MATLLKSNLRYFHRDKSKFEKFDAGLRLRIVFYTHKTIKNQRKNFHVIYTLSFVFAMHINMVYYSEPTLILDMGRENERSQGSVSQLNLPNT